MTTEFTTSYNVLKTAADTWNAANPSRDPITVIPTRWAAEQQAWPLPAFIVDVNGPEDGEMLENGRELPAGNFFYFEAAVKHETDPLDTIAKLGELIGIGETALRAGLATTMFFMQKEISDVPFGKQTSLSFMCTLYVGPL